MAKSVIFDEAKEIADEATRQVFRKFALKSQSNAQLRAMVQLAQHNLQVVLSPDDIDADPMLLGVLNGTIELTSGKFRDGRREDYITKQCAVFFDADAQCPEWIEFQRKIAGGNAELIAYKQRLFGLLLTGEMIEILFILHGGGQNGKSTEFETISGLLGGYAHAADAQVLLSQKERAGATPEIVAVKGKRAVFINETGESDHLNESRVKYLCGNDTMSGRNLYEGIINFRPTHKTLLRTNHKPKIRGGMLAGLKDYLAGGLQAPPIVVSAIKEYRREMDTTGQWIEATCERSTIGAKLRLKTLFKSYEKWALGEVGEAVSRQKLAEALRERGYYDDVIHGVSVFKNIRLKDDEAEPY